MKPSKDITKTEKHVVDGVTYITHYVNRPIRPDDVMGEELITIIGGKRKTTEIVIYRYTDHAT